MKIKSLQRIPLPVSRNILLIFTLAAGVMFFFGRIIYLGTVYTKKTDDMVAHTYRVTEQVETVRSGEAESGELVLNYIINHDKILAKIEVNRKKPKTKSKWQERMEQMQEQQKKMKEMQQKGKR